MTAILTFVLGLAGVSYNFLLKHWRIAGPVLAILALGLLYSCQIRKAEQRGRDKAIEETRDANRKAASGADKAEARAKACLPPKVWDRERQSCD